MADKFSVTSQKLTRDQLSKILPDLRSIRFFENLISDLEEAANSINDRDVVNVWTKNQSVAQVDLTDAAVVAVDASRSNSFRLITNSAVGSVRKLGNLTNATPGMWLFFEFVQPGSGGPCALTLDTGYDTGQTGAPSLSSKPDARDLMLVYYDGTKACVFSAGSVSSESFVTLADAAVIIPQATRSTNFLLVMDSSRTSRVINVPFPGAPGAIYNFNVVVPGAGYSIVWAAGSPGYKWGRGGQDPQPIGTIVAGTDTYSFQVETDGSPHGVMIGQSGPTGAGYLASSTTSLATVGTGSVVFSTQTGLAYSFGARIRATSISTGDFMEGKVSAYAAGSLTVTMDRNSGTGTHADWTINLAGDVGPAGAAGAPGPAGSGNGVNLQTGTTYTYVSADASKLVSHSNAGAIAATLPQATGSFASPFVFDVENRGVGTLTITPTTSTIDGAATLALATNQGCRIFSNGTNWFTQRGIGGGSSSLKYAAVVGNNGGDITTTSTSFSDITGMSVSVAAAVGDRIEVEFVGTWWISAGTGSQTPKLTFKINTTDLATMWAANSFSSTGNFIPIVCRASFTAASGDISGGSVSAQARFMLQVGSSTLNIVNNSSVTPTMTIKNFGP